MIESKFQEIATEVNGIYKINDAKYNGGRSGVIPVTEHLLRVEYKSNIIDVKYEFGNTNVAQVVSTFQCKRILTPFQLSTKSHFGRLFSKNKSPWKVKCHDKEVKYLFERLLNSAGLKQMAEERAFEPELIGTLAGQKYTLKTKFYLGFDDKEESLLPMINFYKMVIDYVSSLK